MENMQSKKRDRSQNWDDLEKQILLESIKEEIQIIENKRKLTSSNREKNCAWDRIAGKLAAEDNNSLIFDNGGCTIKIGYTKSDSVICMPNYIMKAKSERKRCFIADQIEDCRDLSGLFYIMPNDHGFISKFDVQKTVWDYMFNKFPLEDSSVIMTQPMFNFRHVQEYIDEIFFEEYDVKSLYRANPTDLSRYQYISTVKAGEDTACIVVDSGYSFTHVVPYINGKKYTNGIIRLDIGGKLLTNYLKDILSYRQLHVMEETYVINQVKEDTCFMSLDFKADMIRARKSDDIVQNYILPDFHNVRRGYVQGTSDISALAENCQILRLNNERICVPEVLLRPSIIPGMEQSGLAHAIANCVERCPEAYRNELCRNIVMTGGNCCFPGFKERLQIDGRMYLPSHYPFDVYQAEDPIKYAWMGGQSFSQDPKFRSYCVSKEQYEESGPSYTYKKFNNFAEIEEERAKESESEPFSYLAHWKNQGVDLFQKEQMTHVPRSDDVQFMLEGENIEQYDGKYVDIEFEYENKQPKPVEVTPVKVAEPVKRLVETVTTESPDQTKLLKKKKTVLQFDPATNSFIPNPYFRATNIETPKLGGPPQIIATTSSGTQPGLKQPVKVYKPIFKPRGDDRAHQPKRIITLAGNTVTLNGNSILVPTTLGGKTVLNTRHILNNAVILPQHLLSKNVTLQLIPIKPELLRQGNVTTIITKKPQ